MPTAHCKFPEHHTGSGGPVIGWLVALGLGALIITHLHTVEVVLIVLGILAALAVPVFLLWHNHGRGYDRELEYRAALERAQRQHSLEYSMTAAPSPGISRTAALEAENAALRRQIEAPAVHNHLHLHGINAGEIARHRDEDPAPVGLRGTAKLHDPTAIAARDQNRRS